MAKQIEKRVSTRAEDHTKGGGLFDDIDVTIHNPRYEPFQYPGKPIEVTALALTLEREDGDSFDQHWTASKGLMPSKDGEFLVAEDPDEPPEGINESCNLAILYDSLDQLAPTLVEVREEKGLTAALDGLKVHLKNRVPPGEINGKPRNAVLCVTRVYSGGKSSGKRAAAKDDEGDSDESQSEMEQVVEAAVVKILKKAKKPMSRKDLMQALGDYFEGAEKREATEVLVTPGFLKNSEGEHPWEWDGSQASL